MKKIAQILSWSGSVKMANVFRKTFCVMDSAIALTTLTKKIARKITFATITSSLVRITDAVFQTRISATGSTTAASETTLTRRTASKLQIGNARHGNFNVVLRATASIENFDATARLMTARIIRMKSTAFVLLLPISNVRMATCVWLLINSVTVN